MTKTTIEWTAQPGFEPAVWNPTTGCTRVSAGCDNCYAFALHDKRFASNLKAAKDAGAHRMNAIAQLTNPETIIARARTIGVALPFPPQYDLPFSRVQLLPERLDPPLRKRKPTCYFVDSMSDLFHEDVPDEFIDSVWSTMSGAARHTFLVLTKRPERMAAYVSRFMDSPAWDGFTTRDGTPSNELRAPAPIFVPDRWPLPNVWLGTSVEDQRSADERIPHLLATPAAVRFLSCEPLLGPMDLTTRRRTDWCLCQLHDPYVHVHYPDPSQSCARCSECHAFRPQHATFIEGLDWVIVGGESGSRARPMDLHWARSLVDQCRSAGVAVFVKQMGSRPVYRVDSELGRELSSIELPLREAHGRDMDEWPDDLRVRMWPR